MTELSIIEELGIKTPLCETPLAEKILKNILIGSQTYESLSKALGRKKNTINQPIKNTLIRDHYIREYRVKDNRMGKKSPSLYLPIRDFIMG